MEDQETKTTEQPKRGRGRPRYQSSNQKKKAVKIFLSNYALEHLDDIGSMFCLNRSQLIELLARKIVPLMDENRILGLTQEHKDMQKALAKYLKLEPASKEAVNKFDEQQKINRSQRVQKIYKLNFDRKFKKFLDEDIYKVPDKIND